jgi:flagellar basal body P-ring formation protein FlgA
MTIDPPRRLPLISLLLSVSILVFSVVNAMAQTAPRLRAVATVEADVVKLGDLIEGVGAAGDTVVFGAPQPGQSGVISAARILMAARDHGIGNVDPAGLTSIAVRRAARRLTADDISRAIAGALARQHQTPEDAELDLAVGGAEVAIEASATGAPEVRSLSYNGGSGRFEATLVVPGSRQLEIAPLRVVGNIADVVRVPVLTRAVLKGDVVTANDIILERRRRSELGPDIATDLSKLAGNAARRSLPRGTLLREADVQRPELVERNAAVVMAFEQPGIQLSMRGRALAAGAMGDVIQVQNINSRRIVEARIVGPGKVVATGVVLPEKPTRVGAVAQ